MLARILLVDDDPMIQQIVKTSLENHGYEVESAFDGQEGMLAALRQKPDLVITDILMPRMDGWALVSQLRAHQGLMMVPVIFLTALASAENRDRGLRLGAEDYLSKPFRVEQLIRSVEKVLGQTEALRHEARVAAEGKRGKVAFEGDLEQVGLATVLTILEMERNSGFLLFNGERTGRLYLRKGALLDVVFDDHRGPQGVEGLYAVLAWKAGRFEFYHMEMDREDQVHMTIPGLLLEAARRFDEAGKNE